MKNKNYIKKLQKKFGNKYDYSLVNYEKYKSKIKIICPIHGIFEQRADYLISNGGCKKCKGMTTDKLVNKLKIKHNDKYDYSLVVYNNPQNKIKIICKKHGLFEQKPYNHLNGQNCPKCSNEYKILTDNNFIVKSKKIHGNKYDYSLVDYIGTHDKVKIICKKHGEFKQQPNQHLSGNGCIECFHEKYILTNFIERSIKIHNDKYDYSLVDYKNTRTKVKIICPIHGIFEQLPSNHLANKGCKMCNESKGEKEIINYLVNNNISFEREKTFKDCKYKRSLSFDFYLPSLNVCVEYDGIQHFESIEYFGGITKLNYTKNNDNIKNNYCMNNNIGLIRIKYDQNVKEVLDFILI